MKILTWNINGIRSMKEPLKTLFDSLDADIICIQETKVTRDQLDGTVSSVEGYNAYFSFSKVRSGYSGVATFCKDSVTPIKAEQGLSGIKTTQPSNTDVGCYGDQVDFTDEELHSLDNEGRCIITQHKIRYGSDHKEKLLTIFNLYCPRADPEKPERLTFKLRFYQLLQIRAQALLTSGSHVIVLGDMNTSHKRIDHCDPDNDPEFLEKPSRKWLNEFLWEPAQNNNSAETEDSPHAPPGGKFVDTFRYFHPNQKEAFTCWMTLTSARLTNYGTRLDYIFADYELANNLFQDCVIRPDIEGSDHCPVIGMLKCEIVGAVKCPQACVKYLPEVAGKQQKLSSFFKKSDKPVAEAVASNFESLMKVSPEVEEKQQKMSSFFNKSNKGPVQTLVPSCVSTKSGAVQNVGVKRTQVSEKANSKRMKVTDKKQKSVMSFFGRNPKSSATEQQSNINSAESSITNLTEDNIKITPESNLQTLSQGCLNESVCKTEPIHPTKLVDSPLGVTIEKIQSKPVINNVKSDPWKALLKGPPPAPKCKGHNEPCLLRTVKKDSLNKGRQFWVCPRPQGHTTNKEARCEFFLWVEKKKKIS